MDGLFAEEKTRIDRPITDEEAIKVEVSGRLEGTHAPRTRRFLKLNKPAIRSRTCSVLEIPGYLQATNAACPRQNSPRIFFLGASRAVQPPPEESLIVSFVPPSIVRTSRV